MGTSTAERQFDPARPIVAFDFDGTLTVRDSFLAFLRWRRGTPAYALGALKLIPDLVSYAFHRDREALKSRAATVYLRGLSEANLDADAERFAEAHITTLLRPDAAQAWLTWKERGAVVCIVTASPEHTVRPFARRLGADLLLGTHLHVDHQGLITGAFATANCRGQEKVDRLREVFGDDIRLAAAYGDTSGDTEMLAIADAPGFRVFTRKPASSSRPRR
jgi:phosphatidylglycerophosphatase C